MKWYEYKIETSILVEDIILMILSDHNIVNVEIENNVIEDDLSQGKVYTELLPDNMPLDDGKSTIKFYLSVDIKDIDRTKLLSDIQEEIKVYQKTINFDFKLIESFTYDKDWINKWKEFFHEFTIGSFLIKPTWEKKENACNIREHKTILNKDTPISHKHIIYIDPGVSFGTGKHESSALTILLLEKYLKNKDIVFDVGFGSGILSMISYKLGAKKVFGTDISDDALSSIKDNFNNNDIVFCYDDFKIGDILSDTKLYTWFKSKNSNLICANLLYDIIDPMKDKLYKGLSKDGILIVSGIIDFRANDLVKNMNKIGFSLLEQKNMGEWASFAFKK